MEEEARLREKRARNDNWEELLARVDRKGRESAGSERIGRDAGQNQRSGWKRDHERVQKSECRGEYNDERRDVSEILQFSTEQSNHLPANMTDNLGKSARRHDKAEDDSADLYESLDELRGTLFDLKGKRRKSASGQNEGISTTKKKSDLPSQNMLSPGLESIFSNPLLKSIEARQNERSAADEKQRIKTDPSSAQLKSVESLGLFKVIKNKSARQKDVDATVTTPIKQSTATIRMKNLHSSTTEPKFSSISKHSRVKFGPMNIQKLVKVISLAMKKSAIRSIIKNMKLHKEKKRGALSILGSIISKYTYQYAHDVFAIMLENYARAIEAERIVRHIEGNTLRQSLSFEEPYINMEEINPSTSEQPSSNRQAVKSPSQLIRGEGIVSHGRLDELYPQDRVDNSRGTTYRETRGDLLNQILRRKVMKELQAARRVFSKWAELVGDGSIKLKRGLRLLEDCFKSHKKQDSLRGYYGILGSGGRWNKLEILIRRQHKIFSSDMRYSLRKLKIWSKFKRTDGTEEGHIRTIIVKSIESLGEVKMANMEKHFQRKGIQTLVKLVGSYERDLKEIAFCILERERKRQRKIYSLYRGLGEWMRRKIMSKGMIELKIFFSEAESVRIASARLEKKELLRARSKQSGGDTPESGVRRTLGRNPLFHFYEESYSKRDESDSLDSYNIQNQKKELEILQSGLVWDAQLDSHRARRPKAVTSNLMKTLNIEKKISNSKIMPRGKNARELAHKLYMFQRRRIRTAFENILDRCRGSRLHDLKSAYIELGLQKLKGLRKSQLKKTWQKLKAKSPN